MQTKVTKKLDGQFFGQFNRIRTYKRGEVILRAGDQPTSVHFLKDGFVRLYLIAETGNEITFNIFKPGTFFPMIWALGNLPNVYFFEAITDVTIFNAPREKVVEFIKNNKESHFALTKRILTGLDGITKLAQALLSGNARSKVASTLLVLARRFGKKQANGALVITLKLPHRILASMSNVTRETASAELEKFQKEKIINLKDHIIIKNLQKIEEESAISAVEKLPDQTLW